MLMSLYFLGSGLFSLVRHFICTLLDNLFSSCLLALGCSSPSPKGAGVCLSVLAEFNWYSHWAAGWFLGRSGHMLHLAKWDWFLPSPSHLNPQPSPLLGNRRAKWTGSELPCRASPGFPLIAVCTSPIFYLPMFLFIAQEKWTRSSPFPSDFLS